MSISIYNISKYYGTQQALKNISFSIGEGEIVGFLGPNGAGKTTTMRILTGAVDYQEGSVKICHEEVKDFPMKTKKNIGYLPENNPLYTDMYVKEFLLFIAEAYTLDKEKKHRRIEELIDLLGLYPESQKKIGQLSKGYRQRVGLAQALIHDPKVLILDEPTTGLDPNQLEEIRHIIREIGKERTVLFSTHIMQEIEAVCNRVIIINKGEIVADFPDVSQLKSSKYKEFHIEVQFLKKVEDVAIKSIKYIKSAETLDKKLYRISAEKDIRQDIFDFTLARENKILQMRLLQTEIEDVFRDLTK